MCGFKEREDIICKCNIWISDKSYIDIFHYTSTSFQDTQLIRYKASTNLSNKACKLTKYRDPRVTFNSFHCLFTHIIHFSTWNVCLHI